MRARPGDGEPEICVLLLPEALERFARRSQADDLLRAQGVVAVDPPRLSYAALGRLPEVVGDVLAARQARRLVRTLRRHRGRPRAVVLFDPRQYALARAVVAEVGEPSELWYWRAEDDDPRADPRAAELDALAARRAARIFAVPPPASDAGARAIRALDDPVWQALAEAGVDVRVTR